MNDVPVERLSAKAIFTAAVALEEPQQRHAYLGEACGDDAGLRQKVERLLVAADRSTLNPLDRIAEAFAPVETLVGPQANEPAIDISTHPEIGPYKLLEQIGEGGMGVVFMAQQTRPVKRRVALKLVKPGMDSREVIARFEAERQALAMMDHPHISRVLDAGATHDGRPYFVMELVRGVPITGYCDQHRLTIPDRLRLFMNVCHAVQHAHLKGVIHRDLKPSNVLVTQQDGQPVVKVIDFGVAKAINQELTERTLFTRFAQVVGTPLYMSPEQVAMGSLDIDTRSDVYSLGVLLYELLTGETPFDGKTLEAAGFDGMRQIIREREPARPSARVSTLQAASLLTLEATCREEGRKLSQLLRGDLDWIVMQALDKDRSRRYQTATALADDVARFLADQPVLARPPSIGYRLRKYSKRHRAGAILSLVVVGALIVAGVSLGYAQQRNALASAAESERLSEIRNGVEGALQSSRAGIEAESLPVAERWLESARVLLERDRDQLPDLALQVDELQGELEQRVTDADRYAELLRLARDAQDKMTFQVQLNGDVVARQALQIFRVEESADWIAELEQAYLSAEQKTQVREVIYETLLCLADYGPRHYQSQDLIRQSFNYSELARAFHQPTKGLHFARYKCYLSLGLQQDAEAAQRLFEETPATIALDHFLPADSADSAEDFKAVRAAYWAALQLQPDHFNSLYYLGYLNAGEERHAEAVAIFTGCLAIRPDHAYAHIRRGESLEALGELEKAEEALLAATQAVSTDDDDLWICYKELCDFYQRTDQSEAHLGACRDLLKLAQELLADPTHVPAGWTERSRFKVAGEAIRQSSAYATEHQEAGVAVPLLEEAERVLNRLRSTSIPDRGDPGDRGEFYITMNSLGLAWSFQEQGSERALPLLEESLIGERTHFGSSSINTVTAMTNLAWEYGAVGQHDRCLQLIDEIEVFFAEKRGSEDAETLTRMGEVAQILHDAGIHERSIPFLEEAVRRARSVLGETASETLHLRLQLGIAHDDSGNTDRTFEVLAALHALIVRTRDVDDTLRRGTASRLALLYIARGETDRGIDLLRGVYKSSVRANGPQNSVTIFHLVNLVQAHLYAGNNDHAEQLLSNFLDAWPMESRGGPDQSYLFALRGAARLQAGRVNEARDDFHAAYIPHSSFNDLYLPALGLRAIGDQEGYLDVCSTMLDSAGEVEDPVELHWITWACALETSHGERDPEVLAIAQKLATLQPQHRQTLLSLGAILYRQGDDQEAVQTLLAADAAPPDDISCEAYPWFFLALAHRRLGNETEAEQWRQRALEYADRYQSEPQRTFAWHRRKTLELLRDELEQEFAPTAGNDCQLFDGSAAIARRVRLPGDD